MESRWARQLPALKDRVGPSEDVADEIAPAIGRLIIGCGMVDQVVDYLVYMLLDFEAVTKMYQEPQRNFSDEIDFCRRVFRDVQQFENFRESGLKAFSDLKVIVKIRDLVAHGALSHYFPLPEKAFLYSKVKSHKGPRTLPGESEEKVMTFLQIERASYRIHDVANALATIGNSIAQHMLKAG